MGKKFCKNHIHDTGGRGDAGVSAMRGATRRGKHDAERGSAMRGDKRDAERGSAMRRGGRDAKVVVVGGGIFAKTAKTPPLQSALRGYHCDPNARPSLRLHAHTKPPREPLGYYNDAARVGGHLAWRMGWWAGESSRKPRRPRPYSRHWRG